MMLFLKSCKGTKTALGSKKEVVQNSYIFPLTWHKFLGGLFSRVDSGCSWLIPPFHRSCRWSFHRALPGGSTNSSDSQTSCHTDCTGRALAFHSCLSDKTHAQQSHSSRNLRQGREWKAEPCFRDLYWAPPERGLVRLWIRAGCGRPSCDGQGCFEWIPLFHIPDTWSFLRALLRGSSNSGRKRRTFRNWRSGTAWAPGSNNSLDRNNSFSTGRFLFQFSGNTQHVKRHLKAQIILNAESQMFFFQSFALWMRMTRADMDLDRLQQMKWLSVVRRILAKCANQSWQKVYLGERIYLENQY